MGYRHEPTASEIAAGILLLLLHAVLFAVLGFVVDSVLAQGVLLVLGGFHVIAGFNLAYLTVLVAEAIITVAAYVGTTLAK